MRSWPAELISIILLYCFFPWKIHLSFLSTLFLIYNRKRTEKFVQKFLLRRKLLKCNHGSNSPHGKSYFMLRVSLNRRKLISSVQSTPLVWNSPELFIVHREKQSTFYLICFRHPLQGEMNRILKTALCWLWRQSRQPDQIQASGL